ncbi:MAG: DUF4330 domain-containing protein [Thermoleophilia bacterium]|nr:DUF4330 domain-containing protein [Thermoleophilia bacterium]
MSSILDDRGRLFGKVSVVDLFVLLLVVALAGLAYVRLAGSGEGAEKDYLLTMAIEKVRKATTDQFEIGDLVRDDAGNVLGHIESVAIEPTPTEVFDDQGNLYQRPSPVFSDVKIVIKGRGTFSPGAVRAGSLPLRVGKPVTMIGPGFEVKAAVWDIDRADE